MNPEKIAIRKKIIDLLKKNKSTRDIAYLLDVGKSTVSYWKIRFEKTNSLEDLSRSGKPSKLTNKELNSLKATLQSFAPEKFGGKSIGWTTKMAIEYVQETYGVQYSLRRMQELFHKFDLSLITPRSEHYKASLLARNAFRDEFKKNFKTSIWMHKSLLSTKQRFA